MATAEVEQSAEAKPAEPTVLFQENGLGMSDFMKPTTEAKAEEIPPTTPAPSAEVPAEAKPEESKEKKEPEKAAPPKEETKESEEVTKLKKQNKDLRDGFSRERQSNKEMLGEVQGLKQQISILMKKIDGTYDEEKDAPKTRTPQELEADAEMRATMRTSHFAAMELLMEREGLTREQADTKVKELIWNDDAPFRAFDQDKAVQARVMASPAPIIEALKVVREAEDKKKYGDSPAAMRAALEKELRNKIETETRNQVLKELKGKGVQLEELKGLGDVRSVTPERAPQQNAGLTLESLFPNFKP